MENILSDSHNITIGTTIKKGGGQRKTTHKTGMRPFRCVSYPDVVPIITVNGFTCLPHYEVGFEWFSHFVPLDGASLSYRIVWKGDSLAHDLVVPLRVDTIFVNDSAIASEGAYGSGLVTPDEGYRFRWEPVHRATFYRMEVELWLEDSIAQTAVREVDTLLQTLRFHLPAAYGAFRLDYAKVKLTPRNTLPLDTSLMEPHVESERLYCYEDVAAEPFAVRIYGP
jgi:hypothetical protein